MQVPFLQGTHPVAYRMQHTLQKAGVSAATEHLKKTQAPHTKAKTFLKMQAEVQKAEKKYKLQGTTPPPHQQACEWTTNIKPRPTPTP
jgi:hypothetical protein